MDTVLTWKQKFQGRVHTVEWIIKLKSHDPTSDVEVWKWLLKLLQYLRSEGMSSDDTSTENFDIAYRVRILIWRRKEIDAFMDIIDNQRVLNRKMRAPQGARPVKRLRNSRAATSTRRHIDGLPESIYCPDWKAAHGREVMLDVSREQFQWVQVMTR
jgi:hypothetical protein